MSEVCDEAISNFELLGRILNETSQINKQGNVKPQAFYPKLHADTEPGREHLLTNKLSVLRLCRGHNDGVFSWQIHKDQAEKFVAASRNVFRGFMIANAGTVKNYGFDVVPDGHEKNPYHAHIIIPDFNVEFIPEISIISEVLPAEIRDRLDRLRRQMKTVILNRGDRYPGSLNYQNPSDPICRICPI